MVHCTAPEIFLERLTRKLLQIVYPVSHKHHQGVLCFKNVIRFHHSTVRATSLTPTHAHSRLPSTDFPENQNSCINFLDMYWKCFFFFPNSDTKCMKYEQSFNCPLRYRIAFIEMTSRNSIMRKGFTWRSLRRVSPTSVNKNGRYMCVCVCVCVCECVCVWCVCVVCVCVSEVNYRPYNKY